MCERGIGCSSVRQLGVFITIAQRLQLQGVNRKLCSEQSGARGVMINDIDALC